MAKILFIQADKYIGKVPKYRAFQHVLASQNGTLKASLKSLVKMSLSLFSAKHVRTPGIWQVLDFRLTLSLVYCILYSQSKMPILL